ncbi:MAG: hypothetical protein FWF69_03645 [Firmicutes bacterium]|nr:hypothetical protein [Bacillota bacterium]
MRRKIVVFFVKAGLVFCLVIAFLFGVVTPQYSLGFNAALVDKAARLRSLQGPKIVLIGNSNLVFGIDSPRLEEAFGMPVVNMGLHGGVGNAFHEAMAKLNVRAGDIYIVCHTEYDDLDTIDDPSLAWLALENHFNLWPLLRPRDVPSMFHAFTAYLRKALDLWADGTGNQATEDCYSRLAFNEYGDDVYPRPVRPYSMEIDFASQEVPSVGEVTVRRLNALNGYLTSRGATLLVAGYPIANGEYTPSVADYEAFQEALEAALDCPVISYFPDYMLDYDYFYDTIYHLTDDGVHMRTSLLIEELDVWMERNGEINPS